MLQQFRGFLPQPTLSTKQRIYSRLRFFWSLLALPQLIYWAKVPHLEMQAEKAIILTQYPHNGAVSFKEKANTIPILSCGVRAHRFAT